MARRAPRDLRTAARRYSPFRVRNLLFAIRYSLLALCPLALPTTAQAPQDAQKPADDVIRRLGLQTMLLREPEKPRTNIKLPEEVLWVVIVVPLDVLLYALLDMIPILRS